jgi:hypothetical protein
MKGDSMMWGAVVIEVFVTRLLSCTEGNLHVLC